MVKISKIQKKSVSRVINKNFKPLDNRVNKLIELLNDSNINISYYITVLNVTDGLIIYNNKALSSGSVGEFIKVSSDIYKKIKDSGYINHEKIDKEDGNVVVYGVKNIIKYKDIKELRIIEQLIQNSFVQDKKESKIDNIIKEESQIKENEIVKRVPSKYQIDIFDYIKMLANNDPRAIHKHIVIEAVAGSGKTWVIEQSTKLIPPNKSVVFLAFNVSIKDELLKRVPLEKHVKAMTLNSAGYESLRYALKNSGKSIKNIFDKSNVNKIFDSLMKEKYKYIKLKEIDLIKPLIIRLVSLYKATGLDVNINSFNELSEKHSLLSLFEEDYDSKNIIDITKDILNINYNILTNNWNKIDFDDQIWIPVVKNLLIEKYDFVFIDETQDLNTTQLELVIKMCKNNGSIIAVGDRNQSIYQFRGADTEAIPHIIEKLDAKIFPLSITYRCPEVVTKLAQTLVPSIEYATIENAGYNALKGEIIHTNINIISDIAKPKDRIICRNSAPLIKPCFELIRNGKKATILGREIGENLIKLIIDIKGNDFNDFMFRLNKWYENKREKLTEKLNFEALDRITDQYETLLVLSDDCNTIECILYKIKTIFSEDKDSITFSTIHKAKGLEAETPENSIFIIMTYKGKQLIPSPYAKNDEQLKQEQNLLYVAYTRAKNKLYLIE